MSSSCETFTAEKDRGYPVVGDLVRLKSPFKQSICLVIKSLDPPTNSFLEVLAPDSGKIYNMPVKYMVATSESRRHCQS